MYLDKLAKDDINYAHIVSNLRSPYKIILNTKDYFIIYIIETDYYYAECDEKSGKEDEVINKMKELGFNYFVLLMLKLLNHYLLNIWSLIINMFTKEKK